MSYTILYRRLFLKLPSGRYLPLVQAGDNNVYDIDHRGREVRSRSWEAWGLRKDRAFPAVTADDVDTYIKDQLALAEAAEARDRKEAWYSGQDGRRNFGWYRSLALAGRGTAASSYGAFRNFFVKGLKNAIPLEEYVRLGGTLHLSWWEKAPNEQFGRHVNGPEATTEEGLIAAWDAALEKASDGGPWISPTYASAWKLDALADYLAIEPQKKGVAINATFADEPYGKYVATKYPVTLTDDKGAAFVFPKGVMDGVTAFRMLDRLRGGLRSISYEEVA